MRGVVLSILCVLAVLGTVDHARAQPMTIRYGQNTYSAATKPSISAVPFAIAARERMFEKEGIDLKIVPISGGTDLMIAALDKGEVDITHTATPYLVDLVTKGASHSIAIAGEATNPVYSLIARPEITGYADLKGKTLGLSLPVDTISISMRKLLALHGVSDGDYKIKQLVSTAARFQCLQAGECAAVPMTQPDDFAAREEGYPSLGTSREAVPGLQFNVSVADRDWAKAHKEALVRYVRGLAATYRFMHDAANRAAVAKTIVEVTGTSDKIAVQVLKLYYEPDIGVLPRAAEIDMAGMARVIGYMAELGVVKTPLPPVERFVDLDYLRAAGIQ